MLWRLIEHEHEHEHEHVDGHLDEHEHEHEHVDDEHVDGHGHGMLWSLIEHEHEHGHVDDGHVDGHEHEHGHVDDEHVDGHGHGMLWRLIEHEHEHGHVDDGHGHVLDGHEHVGHAWEPPANCHSWFDGCNTCKRASVDDVSQCTMMMCHTFGEGKCTDAEKQTPRGNSLKFLTSLIAKSKLVDGHEHKDENRLSFRHSNGDGHGHRRFW